MLNMNHYNILENLLDVTFGRGSMREGYAVRHKTSVCHESGDLKIQLRFECPVNFNPRLGLTTQRKELDAVSIKALTEKVKNVKSDFKEKSGIALKMKILEESNPEVNHVSHNKELVRARYSRAIVYSLSVANDS
jgi:hypothetical protein